MAKLVPSTLAPSEPFKLVFADAVIDLDGSKSSSLETDDAAVISAADEHPWVDVEPGEVDAYVGEYVKALDPTKDPLSAQHPSAKEATSSEAARKFDAKRETVATTPVVVEAPKAAAKTTLKETK